MHEKKKREWQVRLLEEIKNNKNGKFVTLTFSNEEYKKLYDEIKTKNKYGYEVENEIATIAVRKFLERWRKKHKKSVRHWLVTELGQNGTENIHLHGIIFTKQNGEEIRKRWKYGFVWSSDENNGWVNEQTVNYITKYINKTDILHSQYKPKILTSPGIGKNYERSINAIYNKYKKENTNETYTNRQGYKLALPVYYRNKIYSEEEREKLWIEKLNKNIRYVNGRAIDVSENDNEYYKALQEARELNKELKYGDDRLDWDKIKYERERSEINRIKRIKNK